MSGVSHISITYHGLSATIREWARLLGLDYYTLAARIRRGWSVERALETPRRHHGRGPTTHGQSYSKEHRAWKAMLGRCYYPQYHAYHRYGGRGIAVCEQWRDDFLAFLRDVGPSPSPELSLGRLENDGHYEPGQVEWQSAKIQAQSRCTSKRRRQY